MSGVWSRAACVAAVALAGLCAPVAAGAAPTDPQAASQQPLQIVRAGEAVDLAGALADVPVLVADTGIDLDHPDLQPRLFSLPAPTAAPKQADYVFPPNGVPPTIPAGANGWDMIGNVGGCDGDGTEAPDADPNDPVGCSGHGTAVAGVLGAAWNNGQGGAGIAPNARFIALRTCWDNDNCFGHVQPAAFQWAADRGARVVSMSWLGGFTQEMVNVIAGNPQTLFVAIPSGNGGAFDADPTNPFPCSVNLPNVLCVSTSAPDGGLSCGAFGPQSVDVAAPTENSITTTVGGGFGATGCATSYASPTAAGVATILFGAVPLATGAQVRDAIIAGSKPSPAWAGKSVSGGILDAVGALTALGGASPRLELGLTGRAKQEGEALKVTVSCSAECTVSLKAKGVAAGDPFSSKRKNLTLAAGSPQTVKLAYTRAVRNRIDEAAGRATVTATANSALGQSTSTFDVKLKR